MILMRHQGEQVWHTPATMAYANEDALQALIADAPQLLPGLTDTPIAVVRELEVPAVGYIDVVGVDPEGTIILVECKLRANPEIRRQVVGQAFAYASGLWGLSYEAFDRAYAKVAGKPLADAVRAIGDQDWNEEEFRAAVTTNLAKGRFRLIIAVDEITEELKRILLYLNQQTVADLQVMALELRYIADESVELLVPHSYGEESAQPKATSNRPRWSEETLLARLASFYPPGSVDAVRTLYQWLHERGAQFYWGEGNLAWVSASFLFGGKRATVIGFGEYPEQRGVFSIYFDALRLVVDLPTLQRLVERLRAIPGANTYLSDLEAKEFRRRPNLLIDPILIQSGALADLTSALNDLLQVQAVSDEDAPANEA